MSGCFGRGRRILAPLSKSDTGRLAGMHVQCAVVGRTSSVRLSQTSLNAPFKDLRANYAACYSSTRKPDIASVSGSNGLFYSFFCAVRKMALDCRNARNLSTLGDISDR